ncbi:MAG: S26 family signal peptidase [Candidatus Saccharimonadales bacterium]
MKMPFLIRRIKGSSMLPSLQPGQIVIGWRFGQPEVGDIIILRHDGLEKIKRIDKIEGNKLFVLGDNKNESTDSRQFGNIDYRQVVARIIWPRS